MKHHMKLRVQPFDMIRSGQKTYELRLYDDKRQRLKINDEIEFTCLDAEREPFTVLVKDLHLFSSFAELYKSLPLERCGYTEETVASADPADMNRYYSTDEQSRYGVIAIEIKLL